MILYRLEYGNNIHLYVGAANIAAAIVAARLRGYDSDPQRVLTWDADLVIAAAPFLNPPADPERQWTDPSVALDPEAPHE